MAKRSENEALDSFSVVPYNPQWTEWYEQERLAILARLPSGFLHFEHIGSSAVPGLDAKPIIDMMAAVGLISSVTPSSQLSDSPRTANGATMGQGTHVKLAVQFSANASALSRLRCVYTLERELVAVCNKVSSAEFKKMKSHPTYVALLRGINVGGNRKVQMAKLKDAFERLGFLNVRTFIASGNVIFQTDLEDREKLAQKIEAAIKTDFKIEVKVLLRDVSDMGKLVRGIPTSWVNDNTMKCDVMFLSQEANNKNILKRLPSNRAIEDIKYVPGAVLWRIDRDKANKSRMFRIVGTELYRQITVRNPNTVRKLYELMLETAKS